jgi:hypothetical protein
MKRWLALLLVVVGAVAIVAIPVWLIHPFRPQTARGLEVGYILRRWSPVVTLAAMVLGLALIFVIWRGSRRWWAKAFAVLLILPVFPAAWFARQNHFEWMFNPLSNSAYASAGDASYVNDEDMVIAVEREGDSVAYPVRQMAYHHLAQDTVGGTYLVATY